MAKLKTTPLVVISPTCRVDGVRIEPFTVVGEIDEGGYITASDDRITRGQIIPRKRAGEIVAGDPNELERRMKQGRTPSPDDQPAADNKDTPDGDKKGDNSGGSGGK